MSINMIIAAALFVATFIVIPIIHNLVVKPARIKHNLKTNKYDGGELKTIYHKMRSEISPKGKLIVSIMILFFAISDGSNYFSSFDNLFDRSNVFILVILCSTLAIIADYSPSVICEYLFRDEYEKVPESQKKIIRVFIALMTVVILALIIMLYLLRFNIMDNVFEDTVSRGAMKAMTSIWATLVLGSTVASFLFTAINKTIFVPRRNRYIDKLFIDFCDIFLVNKNRSRDELIVVLGEKVTDIKAETDAMKDIKTIHELNIDVIKAEEALNKALYESNARKTIKFGAKKHRSPFASTDDVDVTDKRA